MDVNEAKRIVLLVSPTIAGPVASVWANALYSDNSKAPRSPHMPGALERRNSRRIRFTTTRTEDAMDSVLPSAPEDFLKRLGNGGRFSNPERMNWWMQQ